MLQRIIFREDVKSSQHDIFRNAITFENVITFKNVLTGLHKAFCAGIDICMQVLNFSFRENIFEPIFWTLLIYRCLLFKRNLCGLLKRKQ